MCYNSQDCFLCNESVIGVLNFNVPPFTGKEKNTLRKQSTIIRYAVMVNIPRSVRNF